MASPFMPGREHEVTITDVASDGRGVARMQGHVLFVPWTLDGERVGVRVARVRRNYVEAELLRVLEPSPFRVPAPCVYFGQCGGCAYQHIRYDHQLEIKRKQITDAVRRLAGLADVTVEPVIPSPSAYGYRDRITVHQDRSGRALGFFATDHRTVMDIRECLLALPTLNARLQQLRTADAARQATEWTLHADTRDPMPKPVGGIVLNVPTSVFFQVNPLAMPALLDTVSQAVGPGPHGRLIDAYAGVGLFTFLLAGRFASCVGVEEQPQAVKWARENAVRLGFSHCSFIEGRVERRLPTLLTPPAAPVDVLLLDPPRAGCHPDVLRAVGEHGPARVIYVSCNPATLARDLKNLSVFYGVEQIVPVDMFPQTIHCEIVVQLHRIATPGEGAVRSTRP